MFKMLERERERDIAMFGKEIQVKYQSGYCLGSGELRWLVIEQYCPDGIGQ